MYTRRQILASALAAFGAAACATSRPVVVVGPSSEARTGGRIGVFALDTESGREFAYRADERFAMCSTFKWALAAAILARVDRGALSLDELVPFSEQDLDEYAPVTRAHLAEGALTIDALARAAVTVSDNTAANLLLGKLGGPRALTDFVRASGDAFTRLDRVEPALNQNLKGDPRDTTTPRAMVSLMNAILCRDGVLSPAARERLLAWLRACTTGSDRIRGGLPRSWVVGDKTGTGANGAVNDVAIAYPPGRRPVLIAIYMSESSAGVPALAAEHATIAARLVELVYGTGG